MLKESDFQAFPVLGGKRIRFEVLHLCGQIN